ncbi:unnamed protein product [Microthlaspi erraticum]|uniref:Uncharacterized protein n=1 Tax=Microthlaspi erraticum TaxID=1685480 RepID=A0A6D2JSI5_9BRAS|nr:unnamed protein product [Microthlaspi erraticum]
MPLEVCNLDEAFRRYHVCTEDWLQPAERTRPDRKGIGFARPSPGPIRPHDRTVRAGRQWTTIDREHHITADPDGRPQPSVDPSSANKKPTYAVLTILSPIST